MTDDPPRDPRPPDRHGDDAGTGRRETGEAIDSPPVSRRAILGAVGVAIVFGDGVPDPAEWRPLWDPGPGGRPDPRPWGDGRRIPGRLATGIERSEGGRFATSVGADRGTVLVGTPPGGPSAGTGPATGTATVFGRREGSWTRRATLEPDPATPGGDFGATVAVDGRTALVSAPLSSEPNGPHSGSVAAFARSDDGWDREGTLSAAGSAGVDRFGGALAVDGDLAVVGAPNASTSSGEGSGFARVFARSRGNWTPVATLDPGTAGVHRFGRAVAVEGDLAVVGARRTYNHDPVDDGVAFVYRRSGGAWSRVATLATGDGDDGFGRSLAIDGERILAGAPAEPTAAGRDAGAAYVFRPAGTGWVREARLRDADGKPNDRFGGAVALEGGVALVGTRSAGGPSAFLRSGGRWIRFARLGDGDDATPRAKVDVALDGPRAVVGIPDPTTREDRAGKLEVFEP